MLQLNFRDFPIHFFPTNLKKKLTYSGGLVLTGQLLDKKRKWVSGIQFSTFGYEYDYSVLNWGTQHNGQGGFNHGSVTLNTKSSRYTHYFLEVPMGVRQFISDKKIKLFFQSTLAPSFYHITRHKKTNTHGANEVDFDNVGFRTINIIGETGVGFLIPISPEAYLMVMPQGNVQLFSSGKNDPSKNRLYSYGIKLGLHL